MNLLEYWKKRCELAEAYIDESPCDPDIYKEQLDAWNNWLEFKKLRIHDVVWRSEQLKAYAEYLQTRPDFQERSNKDLAIDYCDSL